MWGSFRLTHICARLHMIFIIRRASRGPDYRSRVLGTWDDANCFVLADLAKSAAGNRRRCAEIDAIFDVEREINGLSAEQRHAIRQVRVRALARRSRAGCAASVAALAPCRCRQGMDYMLEAMGPRSHASSVMDGFVDKQRCGTRTARHCPRRKPELFAGSESSGERAAAAMYSLIVTAKKLNEVDPRACLADVLARIADHSVQAPARVAAVELARSENNCARRLSTASPRTTRRGDTI